MLRRHSGTLAHRAAFPLDDRLTAAGQGRLSDSELHLAVPFGHL